jgi:hypothetical protein
MLMLLLEDCFSTHAVALCGWLLRSHSCQQAQVVEWQQALAPDWKLGATNPLLHARCRRKPYRNERIIPSA